MSYSKYDRDRYNVSIEEMSSLSGLSIERIAKIETLPKDLPIGRHEYTDGEAADRARLEATMDGIKSSHANTAVAIVGNLIKSNFSVSIDVEGGVGKSQTYCARIRKEFNCGGVTAEGRSASQLLAVYRAIGFMSEAIAAASGATSPTTTTQGENA